MNRDSDSDDFRPTDNGVFMQRFGRGRTPEATYCNKKLCIVATDVEFLASLLYDLSERDDCYYVKYSIKPRDGMYLGRCFLMNEEAVGKLWRELKPHAKLMCSVQDDDFTAQFRNRS